MLNLLNIPENSLNDSKERKCIAILEKCFKIQTLRIKNIAYENMCLPSPQNSVLCLNEQK